MKPHLVGDCEKTAKECVKRKSATTTVHTRRDGVQNRFTYRSLLADFRPLPSGRAGLRFEPSGSIPKDGYEERDRWNERVQ